MRGRAFDAKICAFTFPGGWSRKDHTLTCQELRAEDAIISGLESVRDPGATEEYDTGAIVLKPGPSDRQACVLDLLHIITTTPAGRLRDSGASSED